MKRIIASLLALGILLLCGCQAAPAPQAETAPQTTALETLPETTEAPTEEIPLPTVDAVTETTEPLESVQPGVAESVITGSQKTVHVSTADEFLAAIASDTEIIVDAQLIDFSTASNYGTSRGEHYIWFDEFDGPEVAIQDVSNLTIRGSGAEPTDIVLSCVPRYADVLSFENCSNIYITNITVGHTQEPGYCAGGVLHFTSSQDILVEGCDLYGCGTWGVIGHNSLNLQVINNLIHDCSSGGVYSSECENLRVDGNTFQNLGDEYGPGPVIRVFGGQNITLNGQDASNMR